MTFELGRMRVVGVFAFIGLVVTAVAGAPMALPNDEDGKMMMMDVDSESSCTSDLDCSLNGICGTDGVCVCDMPWSGKGCATLMVGAASEAAAYGRLPKANTWGGSVLFDEATKTYHLYASRLTNGCGMRQRHSNSRIDHAISVRPEGPYAFSDVAVEVQAHYPSAIALPGGGFAIVHSGSGNDTPKDCDALDSDGDAQDLDRTRARQASGSMIHVSSSPAGPWIPFFNTQLRGCINGDATVHPNGTIFMLCGPNNEPNTMFRSDGIGLEGPWVRVTQLPTFRTTGDVLEDPFMWVDSRNNFHVLYHAYNPVPEGSCEHTTVSRHFFSADGFGWRTNGPQPYNSTLLVTDGKGGVSEVVVSTRERPRLLFFGNDGRSSSRQPTHLLTAVAAQVSCPASPTGCVDCKYDSDVYTVVVPLASRE